MQKRTLTVTFLRSVTASAVPDTVEVTVTPLATALDATDNTILLGSPQTQTVLLTDQANSLTFSLVPSEVEELNVPLPYRIAWREKYTGRQYTYDFLMPDADTDFSDLEGLGKILAVR